MRTIVLDGQYMTSKEDTHNYLAQRLCFPNYYGKNLDALHDCLLDISEQTNIVFYNTEALNLALELYASIMIQVFMNASQENDFIEVFFDGCSKIEPGHEVSK